MKHLRHNSLHTNIKVTHRKSQPPNMDTSSKNKSKTKSVKNLNFYYSRSLKREKYDLLRIYIYMVYYNSYCSCEMMRRNAVHPSETPGLSLKECHD